MDQIRRISRWVERCYSTPLMLALFGICLGFFWLFNLSPLPLSNATFVKLSGHEGLLDTMLFYSAQEAYTALTHYGDAGRKLYPVFLAADFVFIPVYSFAFAFLLTQMGRALRLGKSQWSVLNLLPLGIGLFDCIENLCILGMLNLYPINNFMLGTLAGGATLCKWLLTLTALSCLLIGGILILAHRLGCWPCSTCRQR